MNFSDGTLEPRVTFRRRERESGKRHTGKNGAGGGRSDSICSEFRKAYDDYLIRGSSDRGYQENVCISHAFTFETERVSDISNLPHVEGSLPSVCTADPGSSLLIAPNQRGGFDIRLLKDIIIRTAGGDEISV